MKAKTLKVTLTHAHTHAGEALQPGAVLTVPVKQAEWLFMHRVAKPYETPEKPNNED